MKYLTLFFILLSLWLSHATVQAKAYIKTLTTSANLEPLQKNQGYLVLYLDVNGSAPSIEFKKMKARKANKKGYLVSSDKISFTNNTYTIALKDKKKGIYLVPLLAGLYQITRVNAPYYDLPYWLPTENNKTWRFSIKKGQLNFIGELNIARERGTNFIDVKLYNRFATHKAEIDAALHQLYKDFPLSLSVGYRDDFLKALGSSHE